MRRLTIGLLGLVLSLLAAGGMPVQAQTQDVPELAALQTLRDTYVLTFNGRPLQVCQREWASWNRVHGVCHDLASVDVYGQGLVEGLVVEFVLYDGTHYERVNDQTNWTARPDEGFAPDLTLNEAFFGIEYQAVLTRIGAADVNGAATTQYQYWVLDEAHNAEVGGQAIFDLFISNANYVIKSQASVRGAIAGLGEGELAETRLYSDFNTPIVIVAPAAAR